jgi:CelD/BcsL family acetyltransferase involved in cellulose biosynthesis
VTAETLSSFRRIWTGPGSGLEWPCPFVLPPWLEAWWGAFGSDGSAWIRAVWQGDTLIGVAPLMLLGGTASFMGSRDVCDYQDFTVSAARGREFSLALIDDARENGVTHLDLGAVRPDSSVLTDFLPAARERGCFAICEQEDVAMELVLPATWDEFLLSLDPKQRHEIRRKLRRLHEAGRVSYSQAGDRGEVEGEIDRFLELFKGYRSDKAVFLTEPMASFFRALMLGMANAGLLNLAFLEIDGESAAGVLCFDYRDATYLYNNGYDPRFQALSAGVMSKVLSIRQSIREGRARYDLLKGSETYKHRLGAREVPLYRCRVSLK